MVVELLLKDLLFSRVQNSRLVDYCESCDRNWMEVKMTIKALQLMYSTLVLGQFHENQKSNQLLPCRQQDRNLFLWHYKLPISLPMFDVE